MKCNSHCGQDEADCRQHEGGEGQQEGKNEAIGRGADGGEEDSGGGSESRGGRREGIRGWREGWRRREGDGGVSGGR